MTIFQQYAHFTATTAIYPTHVENEYLALGLCSEAGELLDLHATNTLRADNLFKETSDVQWYTARLCKAFGFEFEEIAAPLAKIALTAPLPNLLPRLAAASGVIAGIVKKQLRDGDMWNGEQREEKRRQLRVALTEVVLCSVLIVNTASALYGQKTAYADVLQLNMDKLNSRKERGTLRGDGDNR